MAWEIADQEVFFMELIVARGFANRFNSVQAELTAAQAGQWFPSTVDFRATAAHSGRLKGEAATFDALLDLIAKQPKESIRELGLIGHANPQAFALAGMFVTKVNDLVFSQDGLIHPQTIKQKIKKITVLRDRFAHRGSTDWPTITLYACDAGTGPDLLQAIGAAFEVKVRGFKQEIFWCFTLSGASVARGRTFYDAIGSGIHPDCGRFSPDITAWRPDSESQLIEITAGENAAWNLQRPPRHR
jgi:hypothetical protein